MPQNPTSPFTDVAKIHDAVMITFADDSVIQKMRIDPCGSAYKSSGTPVSFLIKQEYALQMADEIGVSHSIPTTSDGYVTLIGTADTTLLPFDLYSQGYMDEAQHHAFCRAMLDNYDWSQCPDYRKLFVIRLPEEERAPYLPAQLTP